MIMVRMWSFVALISKAIFFVCPAKYFIFTILLVYFDQTCFCSRAYYAYCLDSKNHLRVTGLCYAYRPCRFLHSPFIIFWQQFCLFEFLLSLVLMAIVTSESVSAFFEFLLGMVVMDIVTSKSLSVLWSFVSIVCCND